MLGFYGIDCRLSLPVSSVNRALLRLLCSLSPERLPLNLLSEMQNVMQAGVTVSSSYTTSLRS
uniref:Uncharacterized protein n=1 Tax=Anguilla anguilla TaxID=7936 RepID=A0A0E9UK09_ANGAN